jgi:hypothetical protein
LTGNRIGLSLLNNTMAEVLPPNPGGPTGAIPPMKKTTGRVQPKKETVRINLPPKPTAAPTIKLPTLPPGGPTGASSAAPAPSLQPGSRTAAAPVASLSQQRGAAPVSTTRPAPAPRAAAAAPTIGGLDKVLAIAACIAALVAIGTTAWMLMLLNNAVTQ